MNSIVIPYDGNSPVWSSAQSGGADCDSPLKACGQARELVCTIVALIRIAHAD